MKQSSLAYLLVACLALLPACGARRAPDLALIFKAAKKQTGKRPLIVIPGILGSRLINRQTKEVVWESALRPKTDDIALPISSDLRANRDDLIVGGIIEAARLLRRAPEIYVYRELLNALREYGGYAQGDWDAPLADGGDQDTYYIFAYDWRRDNVENAGELIRRIEALKTKLNRPDLRFNIVAHSMGGLIARYAAMYGTQDLPEDKSRMRVTWAGARDINKIFLFGTPNLGSMDALATLLDGYSVSEGLRRRVPLLRNLSREDALTLPAIYQLLPHAANARFLDENLQSVKLDLYDPATWRKYNWGAIADEKYRTRFVTQQLNARAGVGEDEGNNAKNTNAVNRDIGNSKAENSNQGTSVSSARASRSAAAGSSLQVLDDYFALVLKRARLFHQALDTPVDESSPVDGSSPVKFYLFGGDCEETLAALVLFQNPDGTWRTLIEARGFQNSRGQKFSRKQLTRFMFEPGDGRVTRRSLLGITEDDNFENGRFTDTYTVFACDLHGDVQKNKILQDNALTMILREAVE